MASRFSHSSFLLFLLLFLSSSLPHSLASSKKPPAAARKGDIPFIKCQVCEKISHQIIHQVNKKEAQISPKKVSELQIIEIAENICNLKKEESDWIIQIGLVEKGDKLELVEQGVEGLCNSECKTIERACQEILGYSDTDVAEFVYSTRPSVDQLINFLCKDLSKACSGKPPPLPADRIAGEAFVSKLTKEVEMDKILRSMEGMPGTPGMKMYSCEDLMSGKFGGSEEDDDEEDEEDDFSEKLGNMNLKSKDSPKRDYKQKLLQGIAETGTAIRRHISKVSKHAKSWWRKFTKGSSPAKAKKIDL